VSPRLQKYPEFDMAENDNQTADTADTAAPDAPADSASTAVAEPPPYNIRVEDAGPATKKVFVEVPQPQVAAKVAEQFKELRAEAHIPGFRKGHAPAKLIEKKFGSDIKEQVRTSLIRESYEKAIEENKLQVIGEPEFVEPDKIKLDENAPLSYSFSVEIQPEINLPELKGIKVKKPRISVTDEHINQAMINLREQQGSLVPVEGRGVEDKDFVIADVSIKQDGAEISHQHDAQIVSRPGRIAGLQIDDLDKQLAGLKAGENKDITVKVPDTYPNEGLRGKDVVINIAVKDIKKLEPVELNQDFLDSLGFKDERELRDALREQMEERIQFDIAGAMRRQVTEHLLSQINVELPAKLSGKQADRIVSRRALDLMMRGMPEDRIRANLDRLREGAAEEGAKELKTFFILQKIAEQFGVEVSEGELNGRISMIALQQGKRPEKLKSEMAKDGQTLQNLYIQMREEKALDKVLESAEIEEVDPTAEQQNAVSNPDAAAESSAT
jgi:trigger factor